MEESSTSSSQPEGTKSIIPMTVVPKPPPQSMRIKPKNPFPSLQAQKCKTVITEANDTCDSEKKKKAKKPRTSKVKARKGADVTQNTAEGDVETSKKGKKNKAAKTTEKSIEKSIMEAPKNTDKKKTPRSQNKHMPSKGAEKQEKSADDKKMEKCVIDKMMEKSWEEKTKALKAKANEAEITKATEEQPSKPKPVDKVVEHTALVEKLKEKLKVFVEENKAAKNADKKKAEVVPLPTVTQKDKETPREVVEEAKVQKPAGKPSKQEDDGWPTAVIEKGTEKRKDGVEEVKAVEKAPTSVAEKTKNAVKKMKTTGVLEKTPPSPTEKDTVTQKSVEGENETPKMDKFIKSVYLNP